MPSPKQLLMEHTYPGNLADDVKAMLAERQTWREIAEQIGARCGYPVSYESLRQWYGEAKNKEPAA